MPDAASVVVVAAQNLADMCVLCRCLHQKDVATQHAQMLDYFGPTCTPDTDIEYVKQIMGDRWQPIDWSCIGSVQQVQQQHRLDQQHVTMHIPPPPDPK